MQVKDACSFTTIAAVNHRNALFQFVEELVLCMPADTADLILEEGAYDAAAVLIAALAEGPKVEQLSRLLLVSEDVVSNIAFNMVAAGLWTATSVNCDHWFEEPYGLSAFYKDILVAQGRLWRCATGTGTYYYRQPCFERWAA